jgi:lathosterol oxidase
MSQDQVPGHSGLVKVGFPDIFPPSWASCRYSVSCAFTMGIVSYILSPQKKLAATGIGTAFVAVLLGAFSVEERVVQDVPFSFGVDWFVLALIFKMAIFMPLEKAFARHPLAVLRPEWRTDMTYFFKGVYTATRVSVYATEPGRRFRGLIAADR